MKFNKFVDALYDAGWRSSCDAQHTEVFKLWEKLFPSAAEYLEELEEARDEMRAMVEAEEASYYRDWPDA